MTATLQLWLARAMAAALCGTAALLVLIALADLAAAPVSVRIAGAGDQAARVRLQTLVADHLQQGVPGSSLTALQQRLEQETWVRSARVRWRWPRQLDIQVQEQTPVARWGDSSLLDTSGRIIQRPEGTGETGLARLHGPSGAGRSVKDHYQVASDLLAQQGLGIAAMSLDDAGHWQVELDNGVQVIVGDQDFAARLRRFLAVWQQELAGRAAQVQRVDTRYANGVAVAWLEPGSDILAAQAAAHPVDGVVGR